MIRLLVIADDLTGALDTGVQFAKNKIATTVSLDVEIPFEAVEDPVLVIDSETRHISPRDAYDLIYKLALRAKNSKIPAVYKKVDSVLRGNIGAELGALAHAWESGICFAPAFPKNGRTTKKGVQMLDDRPVAETVFGQDPFEPVRNSFIPEIIGSQNDIPVVCCGKGEIPVRTHEAAIDVFDAESDRDLEILARKVKDKYQLFGGCAGFAAYFGSIISFETYGEEDARPGERLLVFSGSLNDITIRQVEQAKETADMYMPFSDRQLFDTEYIKSEEGAAFLREVCDKKFAVLFSSGDHIPGEFEAQIPPGKKREIVSTNLGEIAAEAVRHTDGDTTIVVFGGDTLYGMIQDLKCAVCPIREIMPGIVLGKLKMSDGSRYIITKSGGFGELDVLSRIFDFVKTVY